MIASDAQPSPPPTSSPPAPAPAAPGAAPATASRAAPATRPRPLLTHRQKIAAVAVAAALVGVPAVTRSGYLIGVVTVALIYAIWAMSLDCFSGLSGRENFGHSLFIGVGAYAAGYCSGVFGWNPWLGIPLGVGAAAAAGVVMGFPTLRLRGPYFSLAMLTAAAVAQRLLLIFWDRTGGEEGIQGLLPLIGSPLAYYYFVLAVTVGSGVVMVALARSRWGLLLRAIRGDEATCQAAGIDVTWYKMTGLLVSAAFAGLGGVLYAHYQLQVSPQLFSILLVMTIVTMVYAGGIATVYGAAGGAVVLSLLGELLRDLGAYRLLVYGVILMLVLFFLPQGAVAPLWRRLGARRGPEGA